VSWLLDTGILPDAARAGDGTLARWLEAQAERDLHLSVLSLAELRKAAARLADPERRGRLLAWLDHDVPHRFAGRLLPVDAAVAARWSELSARALEGGRVLPVLDGLLLATAAAHGLTFVTRHAAGLREHGVAVLDPLAAAPARTPG
jgi:predicted nucleic acid-binding protein